MGNIKRREKEIIRQKLLFIDKDYHTHSEYSYCSEDTSMDKFISLMEERGVKSFAITDHSPHIYFDKEKSQKFSFLKDPSLFQFCHHVGNKKLEKYLSKINNFRSSGLIAGLEIDFMFDGNPVFDRSFRKDIDILIGSIHWLPCYFKKNYSMNDMLEEWFEYTIMILKKDIDILGHPLRVLDGLALDIKTIAERIDRIIDRARERNIALELNSHWPTDSPFRRQANKKISDNEFKKLSSYDIDKYFIERCLGKRVKISIGTDAHSLREFGDFSYHKKILIECGLTTQEDLERVLFTYRNKSYEE